MKVYIVTEIYFSEEGIQKNIKCVCKDKNTAKDKMKEYAKKQLEEQFEYEDWTITTIEDDKCILDSRYESLVFKINEFEVI
nr:MAG TPA: hypothetical protein [Caudoviricetes sp.]